MPDCHGEWDGTTGSGGVGGVTVSLTVTSTRYNIQETSLRSFLDTVTVPILRRQPARLSVQRTTHEDGSCAEFCPNRLGGVTCQSPPPFQLSTGRSPDRFQDTMPIATNKPIHTPVEPCKPRCDDTRTIVPNIILTTLERIIDNRGRNLHIPKVSIIADDIIESLFNVPIPPPTPPCLSRTPFCHHRHPIWPASGTPKNARPNRRQNVQERAFHPTES